MTLQETPKNADIIGAGGGGKGGGGGGRAPVEAPDSLRSKAFAEILIALCEGEVEGLATGDEKSIYLGGVPVQNSDGSFNFSGFQYEFRPGTQDQTHIPLISDTESAVDIGVEITKDSPVVQTITDPNIDAVRVIIGVPSLTKQESTGDINGTTVTLAIDLQSDGGGYDEILKFDIVGKTTTRYQSSFVINLTGNGPWDIRVRRLTDDSESAVLQNKTYWDIRSDIIRQKLTYPNTALLACRVDSSQFSSVPTVSVRLKMKRVRIPSNYNPTTRVYTGDWDGNFVIGYTTNPAWALYDLITDSRYGCGEFISDADLDKWAFYAASRYCDEMVDDGFGGTEPRFSCNIYLQKREQAYKVLRDLASVMRAMPYWTSNAITITQDAPSDPVALYNNSNVEDGLFTYAGTSLETRKTVALVSWNDPQQNFKQVIEYVEDREGIERYGYRETEIVAVGCTSRAQAHRVGKWLLASERLENQTVTFRAGLDASYSAPGEVILVADADRAGVRLGGRVMAASGTLITVDMPVDDDMALDPSATLGVIMPDGTVESRYIASYTDKVINVQNAFSTDALAGSVFIIQTNTVAAQQFRVVAAIEAGEGVFEITAVKYEAQKYDFVENDVKFEAAPISNLNATPASPSGIIVTESLYETNGTVKVLVNIDWEDSQFAFRYEVAYRRDDGNFVIVPATTSNLDIRDAQAGFYEFRITAYSAGGKPSLPSPHSKQILGKSARPTNVENLTAYVTDRNTVAMNWTRSPDLDVRIGGAVRFRHSPLTIGANYADAVDIGPPITGASGTVILPLLGGTYLAKFVDSSGNESESATSVIMDSVDVMRMNFVVTMTEDPAFDGTLDGLHYDPVMGGIKLAGALDWDSYPGLMDSWGPVDEYLGVLGAGEYLFEDGLDLGAVYTSRLTCYLEAEAYNVNEIMDTRAGLVDDWASWDGAGPTGKTDATIYVRTTNDDPALTPTWSAWVPLYAADFIARAFEFKCVLTTADPQENVVVKALSVTVDMPDHVESAEDVVSGAITKAVTYPSGFKVKPALQITAQNMASGDRYAIGNQSSTGFEITFYNSVGVVISRTFDWTAKAYGRRV